MHARAYKNIGYTIRACTNVTQDKGRRFADEHGAEFVERYEDLCRHPDVEFVDVCTFPSMRLDVVRACADSGKPVQVQKPISTTLETAGEMIEVARAAGITLGVVSQHRFDRASMFLSAAIRAGRLGRLLQADAYIKWWRSDDYYARPIKGSWKTEGGGALITQAIHQVDLLLWFAGPVREVFGMWQLGAAHAIESEDLVSATLRYESGATGVIQAATALWPGYSERVEIHGTKGSAIITGDQLTTWDVRDDDGDPHRWRPAWPRARPTPWRLPSIRSSGSSSISVTPSKRAESRSWRAKKAIARSSWWMRSIGRAARAASFGSDPNHLI